jgi:hypothetical protein
MCIFIEIVASTSTTTADTIDYVVTDSRSFTLAAMAGITRKVLCTRMRL